MAIVKMKKLRVIAMAGQRGELLEGLLRLGCVEISEPDGKEQEWSALLRRGQSRLMSAKDDITQANTALAALKKYAQTKDGLFIQRRLVSENEFLGGETVEKARTVSRDIGEQLQALVRLQSEESRLLARQSSLLPWRSLDMPMELEGTENVLFRMCVCPGGTDTGAVKTELAAADAAAELYEISADKQQNYCLLVCGRADEASVMEVLRPHAFSVVSFQGLTGTAAENLQDLERQLQENRGAQEGAAAAIAAKGGEKELLQLYTDRLRAEEAREVNAERLLTDGTILFFEGWAPAERMDGVQALLEKLGCAWEASDPTEEEIPEVPVQLKNNWFTKPLNMVTEMYSLPAYNNVDPNPLMAPFFILFYGIMMADMGYGL